MSSCTVLNDNRAQTVVRRSSYRAVSGPEADAHHWRCDGPLQRPSCRLNAREADRKVSDLRRVRKTGPFHAVASIHCDRELIAC